MIGTILRAFSCFALNYSLDCYFSCTFVHVLKAIEGRLLWEEIQGCREARPYAQSTFQNCKHFSSKERPPLASDDFSFVRFRFLFTGLKDRRGSDHFLRILAYGCVSW